MDLPNDLDALLRTILRDGSERTFPTLSRADRRSIENILRSMGTGSRSVFVAQHPDGRMQYVLLGTDRPRAVEFLARIMQMIASELPAGDDSFT